MGFIKDLATIEWKSKKFKGGLIASVLFMPIYFSPIFSDAITTAYAERGMLFYGGIVGVMLGGQALHDTFGGTPLPNGEDKK